MTNPEWMDSLKYYTKARTTWRLENFYSHGLLRYCPKRIGFTYDGYVMRNQLAVLDYNHHLHRARKETRDGQPCLSVQYSRKTKEWVVYPKRQEKDYAYITGNFIIMSTIMQ